MQGTVVTMLMILAGLGSHNKENDDIDPGAGSTRSAVQGYAPPVAPEVYAPYAAGPYNADYAASDSIGHVLHETCISFFLGHDDDVMTPKEIESAFYAGAYSGLNDYPPSAVLSSEAPR